MIRSGRWLLAVVSLVVAIATFVIVSSLVSSHKGYWHAEATLAVLPANSDPTYDAIYYETLSNGQLVRTLVEVIRSSSVDDPEVSVGVRAIPETSIIVVEAQSAILAVAELAVTDKLAAGTGAVGELGIPYRLDVLASGSGTATFIEPSGVSRLVVAAGAAIAAFLTLIGGVPWIRRQLQS